MIKALLRAALIFIIICIATATFLLTPMGLRLSVKIASKLLPGQLSYQKLSGVIVGPITVDQLRYQNNEESVFIGKLHFNWQPLHLFKRNLRIGQLDIQTLHIVSKKKVIPDYWNEKTIQGVVNDFFIFLHDTFYIDHISVNHALISNFSLTTP